MNDYVIHELKIALIVYISMLLKIDLKRNEGGKNFEYYAICAKFGSDPNS